MGREINVEAGNRLPVLEAAEVIVSGYRAILIDAFERRRQQVGGEAVMLDAVVEIAAERGYPGGTWAARQVLEQGGFIVQAGPSARLGVRRADFPGP